MYNIQPSVNADAAPALTSAASVPVNDAIMLQALACKTSMGTESDAASVMASKTSRGMGAPPRRVTDPDPFMMGLMPRSS